ncbi:MAG: hypothetical protein ACI9BW_003630 [Gammaproteobacteria bacterium]|jgi:hypothetical protein
MLVGFVLYTIGLVALLTTFLPFSPLTIDLVNLSRESQLAIWRHRNKLWTVAGVCWLAACGVGLAAIVKDSGNGSALVLTTVASACLMAFMFWTGYVPFVMTPPDEARHLDGHAAKGLVPDDEIVLGVSFDGAACAYRRDQIARPHYFKDTIAGKDFIVSYCILCNSATAFETRLDGNALDLRCLTAFNNNIIYIDADSGNVIQQLDARVIDGPAKGDQLTMLPVTMSRWDDWSDLHPHTQLYDAPARKLRDRLVALMLEILIPISKLSKRSQPWHRIRGRLDERLAAMSFVLGVEVGEDAIAYALDDVREQSVIEDSVGNSALVLFHDKTRDVAQVFNRHVDDKELHFRVCSQFGSVAEDIETGSKWDVTGRATDGTYQGKQLTALPHFNKLFWFSWALFKPNTRVYSFDSPNNVAGETALS